MGCFNPADSKKTIDEGIAMDNLKENPQSVEVKKEDKKLPTPSEEIHQAAEVTKKDSHPLSPIFEMEIQWFFTYMGSETKIMGDKLRFSVEPFKFWTQEIDSDGEFSVEGHFDIKGKVEIELKHEKLELNKKFTGKFEENSIIGDWKSEKEEGGFKLELVSNIWNSKDAFICFKSTKEPYGIGRFQYGYALMSGTPGSDTQALVNLNFPDGNHGILECTIIEEKIHGKLKLKSGKEEEVFLTKKNEFE